MINTLLITARSANFHSKNCRERSKTEKDQSKNDNFQRYLHFVVLDAILLF